MDKTAMTFSGNLSKRRPGAWMLALALCGTGTALSAQSASDFRLQPSNPSATPTARAPGPVDTDAPVVRTRPTATPSPVTVQPVPQASAAPATTPAAQPAQETPRPAATRAPRDSATPVPSSAPAPSPASSVAAAPMPSEEPSPIVLQTMEALPSHVDRLIVLPWHWFAIPAGLVVLLIGGWIALRRRPAHEGDEDEAVYEEPQESAPAVPFAATPPLRHVPPPAPPPPPPPDVAEPAAGAGSLTLAFEARKLSATLINTSLSYRLVVENRTSEPLTGLIVAGDMIAAHGSLPVEKQLATDGQPLELIKEIPELAPGEVRELTGELRLPLSSINPIRTGSSLLYVPIARLRVEGPGASVLAAWVVGEAPQKAGGGLQPFRLDLGPRVYAAVSQRRLDLAA